jgi:hypothetical protein
MCLDAWETRPPDQRGGEMDVLIALGMLFALPIAYVILRAVLPIVIVLVGILALFTVILMLVNLAMQ